MTSADDERWVEANSILGRYPTPSAAARQRKRRRTIWLIVLGTALVAGVAGGFAAALVGSGGHSAHTNEPSTGQYVLGFGLSGIGLVGGVASLGSLIRAGQWGAAWRSPTTVLTRQQRKQLLREVRGQEPLTPAHLFLARDLARRLVIQRRQALLWASLVLLWVGQAVVFPDLVHLVLFGGMALLWAIAVPQMLRESHRAQRFLDRNDAQFPENPSDSNRRPTERWRAAQGRHLSWTSERMQEEVRPEDRRTLERLALDDCSPQAHARVVSTTIAGHRAEVVLLVNGDHGYWMYFLRDGEGWRVTVSGNGPTIGWDDPTDIEWGDG